MSRISKDLNGVIIPLVTPLEDDESLDVKGLGRLMEHLVAGKVQGIFILGTTGEFPRLREGEKLRLMAEASRAIGGRLPLYIGIGESGTRRSLELARLARENGADYLVVTLPYYYRAMESEEQADFLSDILERAGIPTILYNIPETVGVPIQLGVIEKFMHHPLLAGIKDSGADLEYFRGLLALKNRRESWKVFCGNERVAYDALASGADGLVPSLGNVFPGMMVSMWEAACRADWDTVRGIQETVMDINRFNLNINSSLRGVIMRKKALEILGVCSSRVTEPSLEPPAEMLEEFTSVIRKYNGISGSKA